MSADVDLIKLFKLNAGSGVVSSDVSESEQRLHVIDVQSEAYARVRKADKEIENPFLCIASGIAQAWFAQAEITSRQILSNVLDTMERWVDSVEPPHMRPKPSKIVIEAREFQP